jgi:SAM-dependent methyltransferase
MPRTPQPAPPERQGRERRFFDAVASQAPVTPISPASFERYARPRRPHLFAKEMMFALAGELRGRRVLEVGCGEGVASCQLAWCGARVTAVDLSPCSVEAARQRAGLHGLAVDLRVGDVEADELGCEEFDVVWCDLILHHLVGCLDRVLGKLHRALRPGGLFVAREPVAYAGWLRALRRLVPVRVPATPDEKPLGPDEMAVVRRHFPGVRARYYRVLARIDRLTGRLPLIACAAAVDRWLLALPGSRSLAGNVVLWARKEAGATPPPQSRSASEG